MASEVSTGAARPPTGAISDEQHPPPHRVIRPRRGLSILEFRELIGHRELVYRFSRRDLTLRYRQTALGVFWVVLQPLLTSLIFTFVFHTVAKIKVAGMPYFIFSFAGMLIWNAFSNTISRASISITGNASVITKVFFPRLLLPLATTTAAIIDACVSWAMMILLLMLYHVGVPLAMVTFPLWLLAALMLAQGIGLATAALTVRYRDVQYILPVLIQMGLYASPIAYPLSRVPHRYRFIDTLNPLTGILQGARWSLVGHSNLNENLVLYSLIATVVIFFIGATIFERFERTFSDVV